MNETLEKWRKVPTKDLILEKDLLKKDSQIANNFTTKMEFGTAGIRGLMGAGTNKMNAHTVAAAAKAYAIFLSKSFKNPKIVIGHDNRHNSKVFTMISAKAMEAQGVKVYLFPNNELQPTPLVSYVIRSQKLDGGIIITASHNPKEYNGFKVYNNEGAQLLPNDTNIVSKLMEKIDPLKVEQADWIPLYINQDTIDDYISAVLNCSLEKENNLKVVFSAQNGTAAKIMPTILGRLGTDVNIVAKQQIPDPDFKYTKTPNPEDGRAFIKAEKLARKVKADMMLTNDPDADRLGVAVKYKKRYKYLNGNQMAAIYLDYMLTKLSESKTIINNGFIATSVVSGVLAQKIADKHGIKIYKTHVGFKNIAQLIEAKKKESFLFGYEESYGFLLNADIARDKDGMQAAVGMVNAASYFKSKGIDLYTRLQQLYDEYGLHRSVTQSKKIDNKMQKHLLSTIVSAKMIGSKKVNKIEDYRKGLAGLIPQQLVKVWFTDGSWIAVRPSGTEPKVKIYVQTISKTEHDMLNIVKFEKEVKQYIDDNCEEFEDKKFSYKSAIKYISFVSFIVAILALVFIFLYKDARSSTTGINGASTWSVAGMIVNRQPRGIWLTLWLWLIFANILSAWMKKRMFIIQKEKVKLRHLMIASIMGGVISFVTPFAVGGDAIGYWYLRRKGVKRGALIATLTSNTLLVEARYTLQTIFLVSIGWKVYQNIFAVDDPQASAALIIFFIGLSWTIFATIMIFLLTLSKKVQEFIVRNSIRFLEWFRWTHIYDPEGKASTYQYEFASMRSGMKLIWTKWWFPFELMTYVLIPLFFNPVALVYANAGLVNPGAGAGTYWSQIVANDIIGTANSMSLTPGGSGTEEWLSITINKTIYSHSTFANSTGISNSDAISSGKDLLYKIMYYWPWLLMSTVLIFTTIILENARGRIKRMNKRAAIFNEAKRNQSKAKIYITIFWFALITLFLLLFFFVLLR